MNKSLLRKLPDGTRWRLDRIAAGLGAFLTLALVGLVMARSGRADTPVARYTPSADRSTVTDTQTHLTWQTLVPSTKATWPQAYQYCLSLNLGGMSSGWRLPSVQELLSLIEDNRWDPAIDVTYFPNTWDDADYWTSSPTVHREINGNFDSGWTVDFEYGATGYYFTAAQSYLQSLTNDAGPPSQLSQVQSLRVRCVHD
jgi:hypothetical protein